MKNNDKVKKYTYLSVRRNAKLSLFLVMYKEEMPENEEDEGDTEELSGAVSQLAELHTGLADCYKSLDYLEKFIKVRFSGIIIMELHEFKTLCKLSLTLLRALP